MSKEIISIPIPPDEETSEYDYKGFMRDFRIADKFGKKAIEDTYRRAFNEWKDDVKYFASLVLTLNHQIWYHFNNGDEDTARVYDRLWKEADAYGNDHFTGADADYYFRFLD